MPQRKSETRTTPSEDDIRVAAYHLWERDGRPEGRSDEYWHKARSEPAAEPVRRTRKSAKTLN